MNIDLNKLRELENLISDRIYLQIGKWRLYASDAGLSKTLAIECYSYFKEGANIAARKACDLVEVELGGGNIKLPLAKFISSGQMVELENILDNCLR